MGDVAASGGYYIAMGAKKIIAEPGTITGSIGVVGGKIAVKGLMNKIGVTTDVISRGKNSGWQSSVEPFTASEREVWSKSMDDMYRQFTGKAAAGRKIELKHLVADLAGGRVFTGRVAVENKLVDRVGTLDDAVAAARSLAGIKADEPIDRLNLPKPKTLFESLFGDNGDDDDAQISPRIGDQLAVRLGQQLGGIRRSEPNAGRSHSIRSPFQSSRRLDVALSTGDQIRPTPVSASRRAKSRIVLEFRQAIGHDGSWRQGVAAVSLHARLCRTHCCGGLSGCKQVLRSGSRCWPR